jgi:hypothetical protein
MKTLLTLLISAALLPAAHKDNVSAPADIIGKTGYITFPGARYLMFGMGQLQSM